MFCTSCRHENRDGAAFCEACGERLLRSCTSCGNELRPAARFCDACGKQAGGAEAPAAEPAERAPRDYTPRHLADRILTSRSALEGERKHVTVLFADVADFTGLSERADPEEMHALMDRCFQRILEQVHHYEGTVNQFTGDGVMALFGAPVALEDAPRRAVEAALRIQRVLAPLDAEVQERFGRRFRMRIGIHTGPVVVGRIGDDLRMDYTAVGDTTNLAARLEQAAQPGQVLISATTRSLVSGFFELRELGDLAVKGRTAKVRAFEATGERGAAGRIEAAAAETGLTPLIGRQRELEALRLAFQNARAGRGQVAFLVGEAGIGKSRLLYEFRRRLEGEPKRWIEGRCASYGSESAFLPIIDAVRSGLGIEHRDEETTAIEKLERGILALGGDLAWTLPFLRHLLSLPVDDERVSAMDAVTRRSEISRALHALCLQATVDRPLVLVIEDLHWIDPASEQLLGFLADSIPASRALFLFTHRPGYRHPFGDRSFHVRLALQPLSKAETTAMTGALLDAATLPEALTRLIARKSDGNPFFIEEVTKSLIDQGVVRLGGGRVELSRELGDESVPDSIQDILMARIDRLDDEPKRAIQVASVIGREFALRLLERISELGSQMQEVVGELRALELIYQTTTQPELAFMFKHALTHDVAYQSVLVQRRKALHRFVGAAIEELYAGRLPEHYEALAHHFSAGEDWEHALVYHEAAARKAADAYAIQSAADHCRNALDIAERISAPAEKLISLEELLSDLEYQQSDFSGAARARARVAELVEPGAKRAVSLGLAGHYFLWAHDYARAEDFTERSLAEGRACGSGSAVGIALSTRALHFAVKGRFDDEILQMGLEATEIAERADNPEAAAWAVTTSAIHLKHVGAFREAIALCERTLHDSRSARSAQAIQLWILGLSLGGVGEYVRAIPLFRDAIEVCARVGQTAIQARLLNSLAWVLAEIGSHESASRANRASTAFAAELVKRELVPGAPELYANAKVNLAGNLLMQGDPEAAEAELAPIVDELAQPGDPWMRWRYSIHVSDARARVALARGDVDGALALLDEEIAQARAHHAPKLVARALELRGRALVVAGEHAGAEEALHAALEGAQQIGYPPAIWRACSLLGELARRAGDRTNAERWTQEARGLAQRHATGLEPELARGLLHLAESLETDPVGAYR